MPESSPHRWTILALATLTMAMTVAVPSLCMSVLFDEISQDLDLNVRQVGVIWGLSALPGIGIALFGGAIGDRFGPRRVLIAACLMVGTMGALRGLATSFGTLAATVVLFGLGSAVVPMNTFKTCSTWFPRQQLGLANGVVSMGMALGFMVTSLISATVLSPWLGSWRAVVQLYGAIAVLLAIPWYFTRPAPAASPAAARSGGGSLRETLAHVSRIRNLWLMGWALLGVNGCIQSTLGYLPLYLRDAGWSASRADSAAASFHFASLLLVIPIALWSDRSGSRRRLLLIAALMIATGVGLLSVLQGFLVWGAVILAGMVRDGFMAVYMTMVIETEGVGVAYAGTATGFVTVFSGVGGLLAPPIGNSLASVGPSVPFAFWASLALVGFLGLYAAQEKSAQPAPLMQGVT